MAGTKQALLAALTAAKGDFVSGQALAEQLDISRAAVHKAAAALTAQGYRLEAVSRRGYRLLSQDLLIPEAVGDYPYPLRIEETLENTNLAAKRMALEGAPHGTLILAGHQTAGRGRRGRCFESPSGKGIYMTLLLRPALSAYSAQRVTVAAAVAVCRAVESLCGLSLSIKWVNDLYYQGKKVCGILTEAGTNLESGQLEWLAVGIGLNLTAGREDFSPAVASLAGSLYPDALPPVGRAALAGEIARRLLALCPQFDCLDEYRRRCFVPGHWITVSTTAETYPAQALGIDEEGRLIILRESGREEALRFGEVSIRPTKTD